MSTEELNDWFNYFFEFSTEDKSTVTSVSCKLFAGYVFDKQQQRIADLNTCFDTCYDELKATRDANDELEKEIAELREMIKSFMATNEDLNEWRYEMESTISELLAKGESK